MGGSSEVADDDFKRADVGRDNDVGGSHYSDSHHAIHLLGSEGVGRVLQSGAGGVIRIHPDIHPWCKGQKSLAILGAFVGEADYEPEPRASGDGGSGSEHSTELSSEVGDVRYGFVSVIVDECEVIG